MTLEEKEELINSATSEEELEARMKEINEDKEAKEEAKEEIKEDSGEITPEEERKLLKENKPIEQRSVQLKPIERKGDFKMEEKEIRNSQEYINAYAEYIKGTEGAEKELRTLLTSNSAVTGEGISKIEVPDFIDGVIRTAWEKEGLMSLVRNIAVKGNFKVEFEVSGDPAVVHEEGTEEPDEEKLVLGIVTLTPKSIKKWISISDEALDMRGEEFLRYLYDEITYRIAKKTADLLVSKIASLPQTLTPNADGVYDTVSADKVQVAPGVATIDEADAHLSDEASNITIVMNRLSKASFTKAAKEANYPMNLFEGINVVYNNSLPAYNNATEGQVYAILGDFEIGSMANYPNGRDIQLKFDDKTLMTQDLVKILGRRYVGVEAVADKAFVLLTKPASV